MRATPIATRERSRTIDDELVRACVCECVCVRRNNGASLQRIALDLPTTDSGVGGGSAGSKREKKSPRKDVGSRFCARAHTSDDGALASGRHDTTQTLDRRQPAQRIVVAGGGGGARAVAAQDDEQRVGVAPVGDVDPVDGRRRATAAVVVAAAALAARQSATGLLLLLFVFF